jgi:hypothetical protein
MAQEGYHNVLGLGRAVSWAPGLTNLESGQKFLPIIRMTYYKTVSCLFSILVKKLAKKMIFPILAASEAVPLTAKTLGWRGIAGTKR